MPDTLTQKEVDAMLRGATPVETDASIPDVVPYNFIRPPRVSKDRRATLDSIYSRFALALQSLFSTRLRTPMDVVVTSVEQAMFSEFILSLATPSVSFVFKGGDQAGGRGVIDLSPEVAFHLLDRLFGGPGDSEAPHRSLTTLEQTVIRGVIERCLVLLREAWQDQMPMAPEIVGFESNPDMLQITSRGDSVLVTILEIRSAGFCGNITVCLPVSVFEPHLQEKSAAHALRRPSASAGSRAVVESGLRNAHLALAARLPTLWLNARAVAELQEGQVIQTGHAVDAPVEVHVNGVLRYLGSLGQIRRRISLRIAQPVIVPVAERPGLTRQGRVS